MENGFKYKGKLYRQDYAWIPMQVTSGAWVWLTFYYARETHKSGWITMTPFEFLLDCNYD